MTVFQELQPILRRLGFKLQWKAQEDGESVRQYERAEADGRRKVFVRIYERNSTNTVDHSVDDGQSIYDRDGKATILATPFTDAVGMVLAIDHEATRMDSERWVPGWQTSGRNAPK
jgi:hypothetical protein